MGYGGAYVLSDMELCRKAAVMARAVMLGGGGVVQVGFGVEDNVGGSEDGLIVITVERVVHVGSAGHVASGGGGGGIGSHCISSNPRY
jgi:hypothetical protein